MDVTTLPETWGTWAGFIGQAVVRQTIGAVTVAAIALGTLVVAGSGRSTLDPFTIGVDLVRYWSMTLIIIVLFQPELFRLGSVTTRAVPGSEVRSFVAAENGAPVRTAQQLAAARGVNEATARVPHFVFMLVRGVSGASKAIGRALSRDVNRPGSYIYPLAVLAHYRLPNTLAVRIQQWTTKCVIPAKAVLSGSDINYTDEDLRLAPGSALWTIMIPMRKPLGRGVLNLAVELESCAVVGQQLYSAAMHAINTDTTPGGTPFGSLWTQRLGVKDRRAAENFLTIIVEQTQGGDVPPPSLMGRYAGIQAVGAVPRSVRRYLKDRNLLSAIGSGLFGGAASTAEAALAGLARVVTVGLYFNHAFPTFLGESQTIVLTFIPVAVLWAVLSPGHHLRPLGIWVTSLAIVYSGPVVFGLIGLMSRLYGSANLSLSSQGPIVWLGHYVAVVLIQSSGPLVFLLVAAAIGGTSFGISRIARGL